MPQLTTRGRRGPYAKSAERRSAIIDAGVRVFSTRGYRAGSVQNIAAEAGISLSGLLHHFPSKEELLAEILAYRDEEAETYVGSGEDVRAESLAGLVELVAHNQRVPGLVELFCVLSAEATDPAHPAHDLMVARFARVRAAIAAAFRDAEARGLLADGVDPDGAAREAVAVMDGLQLQWILEGRTFDMAARLRSHLARTVRISQLDR